MRFLLATRAFLSPVGSGAVNSVIRVLIYQLDAKYNPFVIFSCQGRAVSAYRPLSTTASSSDSMATWDISSLMMALTLALPLSPPTIRLMPL